jgi:hypothetical protein
VHEVLLLELERRRNFLILLPASLDDSTGLRMDGDEASIGPLCRDAFSMSWSFRLLVLLEKLRELGSNGPKQVHHLHVVLHPFGEQGLGRDSEKSVYNEFTAPVY